MGDENMTAVVGVEAENHTTSATRESWKMSGDSIVDSTEGYGDDVREVMVGVHRWCIDPRHPISRAEFSKRVGYDETTVYKFFTNKYRHPSTGELQPPPQKFVESAKAFLKIERDRHEGGSTEFVLTPTAKKLWTAFDLARESRSPVIVWGPSQIGKTWAAEYYRQKNNHGRTIYVRMKAASGLGGMVREIAAAFGISERSSTASLIERIKRALTMDTLVILDEMHLLSNTYRINSFFACLEVLRDLYDWSHCGMVLIWTRIDSLKQHSDRELQQLWRRGVHKRPLPDFPTKGDVRAIVEHAGLEWPETVMEVTVGKITERPVDIMRQVSKRDGLKAITERLRYGRKLASRAGVALEWSHVVRAHLMIEAEATADVSGGWE